jgi:heat shock protein HtpX
LTGEETAEEEVREGHVAFRLRDETPLYKGPSASGEVLGLLATGSLITVREEAGDFLMVVTPQDSFGYIAASTPVVEVEPSAELTPHAAPASPAAPANPAGELFTRLMAAGTPVTVGAFPGTPERPHMAGDDSFQLARPLEPQERVLIYDRIAANKRSTFILMGSFIIFLSLFFLAVGYYLSAYGGVSPANELGMSIRIGLAGFLIALAIGIMMYYTSAAAVLMISGAHEVTKQEEPELYRIVENLSIGSGLPMPKVYVIEDSAPNALATGRDPAHAYVAATRGLLNKMEKRELEAVMAHEMSHVGNYDIRIMTMIAVAVGLIAMIADLLLRFTWYGAGARSSNRDKGGGAIALILLAAAFILIVVSPIVASLIRLALSRQREYLADASGALLCRNPDALADALEKIAADPEPLREANKATAHMYIENPLKEHASFLNNLFSTHPPVQERIRLLRAMA